jgi:hypothetical protein
MYLNSVLELRVYSIYDPSLNGAFLEVGFARGDKIFGKAGKAGTDSDIISQRYIISGFIPA